MSAGATSERVYDGIKRRLLSGEIPPGERLEPAAIADELSSSVTPVRDALHRLVGERLVETRTGTGFFLLAMHEPDLRDLYAWNGQMLIDAMRWWPAGSAVAVPEMEDDPAQSARDLFGAIARRSGNHETIRAIDSVSDRLAAARAAELLAIGVEKGELDDLHAALANDAHADLGKLVRAYHRRRLLAVPAILRALYRSR